MRKVLILAYYFPPLGMGGTQRVAKFVKYLPKFGWHPTVVTVKNVAYYAYDYSLLGDVRSAHVVRTGSADPQRVLAKIKKAGVHQTQNQHSFDPSSKLTRLLNILNKVLSIFLIPDSKVLWLPFAISAATNLLKTQKFNAVITTSPPHSIHFAGMYLQRRFKIPWIADFRDGWVGGEFQNEILFFQQRINQWLQSKVLERADHIVAVSEGLALFLKKNLHGNDRKFTTITNGFDSEDFIRAPKREAQDNKFTFCHCGAVTAISDPDPFFSGLKKALLNRPNLRNKVRVEFVGHVLLEKFAKTIRELGLSDIISLTGYKSHDQALSHMKSADVLLLTLSEKISPGFIPGKLFEYLGAQKPILAIIPPGDSSSILMQSGIAFIVYPSNSKKIGKVIIEIIEKRNKVLTEELNKNYIQRFERRYLTNRLVQELEKIR